MNWYKNDGRVWAELIETVASETNKDALTIEKDVVQSLILSEISTKNHHLVFKGGTSLSKAFDLINRFSEDLDISMDVDPTESEKRSINQLIKNTCIELGMILENSNDIKSRYDYNRYEFSFSSLFTSIKQEVIVETSFYQSVYPTEKRRVLSYIEKFSETNKLTLPPECKISTVEMQVQCLDRTFIEKVFAICDYYVQNIKERNSRHLYDIYKLFNHIVFDDNFKELILSIREDRIKSKNNPSAQMKYNIENILKSIIEERFFEKDYNDITTGLLYEQVSYYEAVSNGIEKVIDLHIF
jgi:predicted nucleotidyltransferase component of viral defense system